MSPAQKTLKVSYVAISALAPYAHNPRTHSKKQIQQIAESIKRFGWTNPILIDDGCGVIAGHGRLEAAKSLGLAEVPVIRLGDLSEAQKRAYVIADNKLAENAGWDAALLKIELQGLIDLDFDIGVIGFETPELDILFGDDSAGADEAEAPPAMAPGPAVTRRGDLWRLGEHRILCGDAASDADMARLMASDEAGMIFTDPPYNVPIDGHVCGKGRVRHDDFVMAAGEMSRADFTAFLRTTLAAHAKAARDGAIAFVCMDWRHMGELLEASEVAFDELKNLCVWRKSNGGMGSLYRSQHELVFVFKKGEGAHINNVALGRHGRNRTNVWDYPGVNAFGATRDADLAAHPTVKPVAMIEDAIKDCSHRGDIVLDGFAGSGSTLIAANRCGRRARGMELDPRYVDVVIRRFEETAGEAAVLDKTGQSFDAVRGDRLAEPASPDSSNMEAGHEQ